MIDNCVGFAIAEYKTKGSVRLNVFGHHRSIILRLFPTVIVLVALGFGELCAQWHVTSSEAVGNYSSVFWGMANRSGLRSGWDAIPDTMESKSSELMLLTTVLVPIAGDITESSTFALGMEIPYASKRLTEDGQDISLTGIGDVAFLAKYGFTIYEESASEQQSFKARVDLIGKIKFPSGESQSKDAQRVVLPHHVQLGSGSTDYAFGFAFLTETEKYFMIHGHAMYWLNSPRRTNGYKVGNHFDYELAFLLAVLPIEAGPVGTFLPYVGVKGMHSARDNMDGMPVENSGADVVALSIGIQSLWNYVSSIGTFYMFDVSYQLPVVQRVNGVQMGYASAFSAGIRVYVK